MERSRILAWGEAAVCPGARRREQNSSKTSGGRQLRAARFVNAKHSQCNAKQGTAKSCTEFAFGYGCRFAAVHLTDDGRYAGVQYDDFPREELRAALDRRPGV